jgi:hypothetical protein
MQNQIQNVGSAEGVLTAAADVAVEVCRHWVPILAIALLRSALSYARSKDRGGRPVRAYARLRHRFACKSERSSSQSQRTYPRPLSRAGSRSRLKDVARTLRAGARLARIRARSHRAGRSGKTSQDRRRGV